MLSYAIPRLPKIAPSDSSCRIVRESFRHCSQIAMASRRSPRVYASFPSSCAVLSLSRITIDDDAPNSPNPPRAPFRGAEPRAACPSAGALASPAWAAALAAAPPPGRHVSRLLAWMRAPAVSPIFSASASALFINKTAFSMSPTSRYAKPRWPMWFALACCSSARSDAGIKTLTASSNRLVCRYTMPRLPSTAASDSVCLTDLASSSELNQIFSASPYSCLRKKCLASSCLIANFFIVLSRTFSISVVVARSCAADMSFFIQHFLYLSPEPQPHASFGFCLFCRGGIAQVNHSPQPRLSTQDKISNVAELLKFEPMVQAGECVL
eukprot:m.90084 g.90084  ORF g.90084 m.90084 type:complete len:325 (-) comp11807_c0_seq1:72-1046(-)